MTTKIEDFTVEQLKNEIERRKLESLKADYERLNKLNSLITDIREQLYKLSDYCDISGLHLLKDSMLVDVDIAITEVDLDKFYNNRGNLKWDTNR